MNPTYSDLSWFTITAYNMYQYQYNSIAVCFATCLVWYLVVMGSFSWSIECSIQMSRHQTLPAPQSNQHLSSHLPHGFTSSSSIDFWWSEGMCCHHWIEPRHCCSPSNFIAIARQALLEVFSFPLLHLYSRGSISQC